MEKSTHILKSLFQLIQQLQQTVHNKKYRRCQNQRQRHYEKGADICNSQLKEFSKQQEAAKKILALGMSVRAAETLCKNMAKEKPVEKEPEVLKVDYVAECEKSLSKHLGRGVKIINGKRKGKFELEFYGQEDLQNLLDALMKLQK